MATDMTAVGQAGMASRALRAQLREEIRSGNINFGRKRLAGIIAADHASLATLRVWDALLWVRRIQEREVRSHLHAADVLDPYRLIGELTERQRLALSTSLVERARG